jgi:hypothetical protein
MTRNERQAAIIASVATDVAADRARWSEWSAAAAHPVLDAIMDERRNRPLPGYGVAAFERIGEALTNPVPALRVRRATALHQARYCRAAGMATGYKAAMRRAAEYRQQMRECV